MGKLFLFAAAVQSEMYWLIVIASAIGIYYYLYIVVLRYMSHSNREVAKIGIPVPVLIIIAAMVVGTLYFGIQPGLFLNLAREAVAL